MTTRQFIDQCKKINARKASSPFTPSLSEFKAAAEDWEVVEVDACLTLLAVMCKVVPQAWKKTMNVMIPKKKLSKKVSKLQFIVLMNARFKLLNQTVARQARRNAENLQTLPPEVYGGRKDFRAVFVRLGRTKRSKNGSLRILCDEPLADIFHFVLDHDDAT